MKSLSDLVNDSETTLERSLGHLCNWAGDEGLMLCVNLCPLCSMLQINLLSMEHNFDMVSVVL